MVFPVGGHRISSRFCLEVSVVGRGGFEQFIAEVNTRPHRITHRPLTEMLAAEHEHLHRLPSLPHTLCFGQTRKVNWLSTISVGSTIYSVPHELVDERVWVRIDGAELIVVHVDGLGGPREVAGTS